MIQEEAGEEGGERGGGMKRVKMSAEGKRREDLYAQTQEKTGVARLPQDVSNWIWVIAG